MKYSDILEKLDNRYSYTNYNTKPVRKLNEVWKVCIVTNQATKEFIIRKPTAAAAEKAAHSTIGSYASRIIHHNTKQRMWLEELNQEYKEGGSSWYYTEKDIEADYIRIEEVTIEVTDRDNNVRTIKVF